MVERPRLTTTPSAKTGPRVTGARKEIESWLVTTNSPSSQTVWPARAIAMSAYTVTMPPWTAAPGCMNSGLTAYCIRTRPTSILTTCASTSSAMGARFSGVLTSRRNFSSRELPGSPWSVFIASSLYATTSRVIAAGSGAADHQPGEAGAPGRSVRMVNFCEPPINQIVAGLLALVGIYSAVWGVRRLARGVRRAVALDVVHGLRGCIVAIAAVAFAAGILSTQKGFLVFGAIFLEIGIAHV